MGLKRAEKVTSWPGPGPTRTAGGLPAHPGKVPPEIASSVGWADVDGVHQDGVALWDSQQSLSVCPQSPRSS